LSPFAFALAASLRLPHVHFLDASNSASSA
jgi:hypothetical protein